MVQRGSCGEFCGAGGGPGAGWGEAGPVGQASCQAQRRRLDFVLGQSGMGWELGSAGVTL